MMTELQHNSHNTYRVSRAHESLSSEITCTDDLSLDWTGESWINTPIMPIKQFLPQSSSHRPGVELKLQYNYWGLCGLFRVQDRFVRCTQTQFQSQVCEDSCVELFLQPFAETVPEGRRHASYISLEMSGNGTLLSYHIRDSTRAESGFRDYQKLTAEDGRRIKIRSSLPGIVDPEITRETEWRLAFFLPFQVMSQYLGPAADMMTGVQGRQWRANAFKCADGSSHPHWCSWQACSELDFHKPEDFGFLLFE